MSRLGSFINDVFSSSSMTNRHDSSVGSEAAWNASEQDDPHVKIILSLRFVHKMIYSDILPLPRIHEDQLSAAGER